MYNIEKKWMRYLRKNTKGLTKYRDKENGEELGNNIEIMDTNESKNQSKDKEDGNKKSTEEFDIYSRVKNLREVEKSKVKELQEQISKVNRALGEGFIDLDVDRSKNISKELYLSLIVRLLACDCLGR